MMEQHDLKSSAMCSSFKHFHSPEGPDPLGKEKSSSDFHEVISDGCPGFDKQKHGSIADPEVNGCDSAQSAAMKRSCLNHDQVSSICCSKENPDDSILLSSVVSPSSSSELIKENFAEVTCRVMPGSGNLRNSGTSALSPKGVDFTPNISMKSDVSMEERPTLGRERDELVGRIANEHWDVDEDGSKLAMATCQSKQLKTESASSNSTPAILPASSNDSCQETSVNAKSCERSEYSGVDTCIYNDYNCNPEESAFKVSEKANHTACSPEKDGHLGTTLKTIDSNVVIAEKFELQKCNSPEKENADFPEVKPSFGLNNVLEAVQREVAPEGGTYRETSGSCSSVQGQSGETFHMSLVDSAVSDKGHSIETGSKVHFGNERDRCDSFSGLCMPDISLDAKETSTYRDHMKEHKDYDGSHGQGSSPCTIKSEYITAIDRHNCVSRFDLNENIQVDEVDYAKLSIKETVSFHAEVVSKPIPMVAKSGISIGLPKYCMQLDEAGGWRGSAATSAFRSTTFPHCISRTKAGDKKGSEGSQGNGFDLNIAAEGGDCDLELLQENRSLPVSSAPFDESSRGINSSRAEKFNIDLNCVSEEDNNGHQVGFTASSLRNCVKDFDLNYHPTSANECSDSHLSAQGNLAVNFLGNLQHPESNSLRSSYHADLGVIQSLSHGQAKPFFMAAPAILRSNEQLASVVPLQPRQTYTPYPPQTLLCNNAFFIDPNSRVYPPGFVSYNITNPQVNSFFPQILGSNAPSAFLGTPYMMHGPGGVTSNDIAMMRPLRFDPDEGMGLAENGSRGRNGREMSVPLNGTKEDQMRSFQPALKRREPDGGWDSHQLGFR